MTDKEWQRIDELVETLGCSIAEAQQIIEDDKKIDKGEQVDFGLSKEDEKQALKYANVKEKKKPMVLNLQKRERKADTTKEGVIQAVYDFLVENGYEDCEITNKSKLIAFKIGEDSYELNLIRKRKPKN
jgi:hypothetical protein